MLLAAAITLGMPLAGSAQTAMTGTQQTVMFQSALARMDRETQMLASMKNHISSSDIVAVSVAGLQISAAGRQSMSRMAGGSRHAALQAALSKATVASVDRTNGQSEDQSSLAEYLQHLGIDPNNVVAVDVNGKADPQNPRVTVFYRR
ncbi:MAG: hypothetical protein QOJ39_1830 [Candidatus Eremiobacteraeota bacterium]|nr:hypothetical protein [Candidatus Eremiobacteraeota bacterium]